VTFVLFVAQEITVINWTWHNPPGFEDDERRSLAKLNLTLKSSFLLAELESRARTLLMDLKGLPNTSCR